MEIDLESFAVAVKGIWYIGFTAVEPFEWETFCLAYSPNHTVTMAYKVTQVKTNDKKTSAVNLRSGRSNFQQDRLRSVSQPHLEPRLPLQPRPGRVHQGNSIHWEGEWRD